MKVLHIAAEVAPFVKVGGLSQVMYFLPKALRSKNDMDVRVFTPKYGVINWSDDMKREQSLDVQWLRVPLGESDALPRANEEIRDGEKDEAIICNVVRYENGNKVPVHFLENAEYYEYRANVFGYIDDHVRFALLSKACLEWLLYTKTHDSEAWFPDIIHCHDWHTGYLVDLAKRSPRYKEFLSDVKIVFTAHNFAYQGNYDFRYNLDKVQDDGKKMLAPILDPKLQKQNAMLRAILYSDAVNTVSPTHAKEVLTPEYAEGLEYVLQGAKHKLSGIMNGLDFEEFNPEKDEHIMRNFNFRAFIKAREVNKADLQETFGLPKNPESFLLGSVGRVAPQKGWDLVLELLPNLLRETPEMQMVIVGRGDDHYCMQLAKLKKQFAKQIGLRLVADFTIPRKLFAGSDAMLMASSFEPGGIVAFEAMRYGSVPIIRRTGGLNDAVSEFNPLTGKGNGFSFTSRTPWALYGAIIEASTFFTQKNVWHKVVENCIKYDSSWEHSAKKYVEWYRHVLYSL
ncbi:MAG: glycogen/starch synthase [Patescibacteria group bacterium]